MRDVSYVNEYQNEFRDEELDVCKAAEVLYAAADALSDTDNDEIEFILKINLQQYVCEENLKYQLKDPDITLARSILGNGVRVAVLGENTSPYVRKDKLHQIEDLMMQFVGADAKDEFDYDGLSQVLDVRFDSDSPLNELLSEVEMLRMEGRGASPLM